MKFSFFILICLALLATMLPATVFGKPLLNSAAGKGFGAFGASTAGNADNAPDRFRRNVDNIQLVTAAGSAANFNSLNRFAGTVDAEFSRAARSQTLNRWQVIFRKVKNNNNNNQAVQPKLDSELEGYQTTAQAVTEDVLGEELRNAAAAAVTSALAFRSSSTEVPSEEEAMVDAAKKSTEEAKKKASLVKAIRIMKAQKISPDIIYSIVQNYQDDPERLMAILTSNKI